MSSTNSTARRALTTEEQRVVVVDDKEGSILRTTKAFLVGKVLSHKPVVKERFKRRMMHLWRPKAKVTIVELDDDRFSIGFKNKRERAMVLKGGPWLYDGALLILAEADSLANPNEILLYAQEFWVQIKGLPLAYMTRRMGQFIGNQLGEHVLTGQSRKGETEGRLLRIRVALDITKPFRRSLLLSIEGSLVRVDLRYEKLPVTCFLCGIVGHTEKQCELFEGKNNDDLSKPYGRWFQNDVLDASYLKAPLNVEEEEEDDTVSPVVRSPGTETNGVDGSSGGVLGAEQERRGNNGSIDLPDLNEGVDSEAVGPFRGPPTFTKLEAVIHGENTTNYGGLHLFGSDSVPADSNASPAGTEDVSPNLVLQLGVNGMGRVGPRSSTHAVLPQIPDAPRLRQSGYDLNASPAGTEEDSPNLVLQLSVNGMGRVGPRSSTHAALPQIPDASRASGGTFGMGSDPFDLMPIIEQSGMPLPKLGKRFEREGEDVLAPSGGRRKITFASDDLSLSVEVDGVQPRRTPLVA